MRFQAGHADSRSIDKAARTIAESDWNGATNEIRWWQDSANDRVFVRYPDRMQGTPAVNAGKFLHAQYETMCLSLDAIDAAINAMTDTITDAVDLVIALNATGDTLGDAALVGATPNYDCLKATPALTEWFGGADCCIGAATDATEACDRDAKTNDAASCAAGCTTVIPYCEGVATAVPDSCVSSVDPTDRSLCELIPAAEVEGHPLNHTCAPFDECSLLRGDTPICDLEVEWEPV